MKAIQNSHKSKTNIIYNLEHYILYIVHFITHFFTYFISLLRRFVTKLNNSVIRLSNKVLGLYSFKTLWRRSRTFNKFINATTTTASALLVLLSLSIIIPLYMEKNNVEAATSPQTAPTLTVNVTNDTASLDLVVRDDNGTFASSSTSGSNATFTVTTNNFTGYTLSIESSSSDTNLTNTSTNPNSVLETIGSSIDSNTFDDENYNGKWGYLPSKYNSSTNTTTYYPSPTTTGVTLDKTSAANTTANSYTIAIGARADYSKPTGTYSNTYILTTVINGFDYSISYNKGNTTDVVTNLPNAQTASATSDSSITLSSTEPTRSGYEFKGWCSALPTMVSGTDSCSGDTYATGATYYFGKTTNNSNITLYAMWKEAKIYMQDMTFAECPSTATKVYDKRDDKDYQIVKITYNGKSVCWMVQNLRFTGASLDTTTSNVSTSKTLTYYGLTNSNCANSFGNTNPCINDSSNTTTGVWYNFAAASAGYVAGDSNDTNSNYDICPKNWHLPTGPYSSSGTDGYSVFQNATYNNWIAVSSASMPLQNYFKVTGGYYYNRTPYETSNAGHWWSATAYNSAYRYTLIYHASNGFISSSTDRYRGLYVRCVMTPTINDITYLQEATQSMVSQMEVGDTATLLDKRDNQSYTVGKLADGNLWLLDNLKLGAVTLTESLSTSNTNMSPSISFSFPSSASTITSMTAPQINTSYYNAQIGYGNSSTIYGVYYNYCAASAGTICGNINSNSANYDICPYQWRIPTGGSSGNYQSLYNKYNAWTDFRNALHVPLSGLFGSDAIDYVGTYGFFWTSTHSSGGYEMYALQLNGRNSAVNSTYGGGRGTGFSIRCILKASA